MAIVSLTYKMNLAELVPFAWLTLTMVKLFVFFHVIRTTSSMMHVYNNGLPLTYKESVQFAGKVLQKEQHNHRKQNTDANYQPNSTSTGDI